MAGPVRYFRLLGAFARFGLATEMAFRVNFLVKLSVEALWLGILLVFYLKLFDNTSLIAGWDRYEYLFFIGCHYALGGLIDTFFLSNCTEFSELVRTGDLDIYLLRPIDEQFLVTCRTVDWSTAPNVVLGAVIMAVALAGKGWTFDPTLIGHGYDFDPGRLLAFVVLFGCGCAMSYSFLLMLCSSSVYFVRNQSLLEMWWLFTTLMRYPRQIFSGRLAGPFGLFFTYVVPVVLVINVPAQTMVKAMEPHFIALMLGTTVALLWLSRRFFRRALRSYRSASS